MHTPQTLHDFSPYGVHCKVNAGDLGKTAPRHSRDFFDAVPKFYIFRIFLKITLPETNPGEKQPWVP